MPATTVTWNGMTKTWIEWARWMGLEDVEKGAATLRKRLKLGWSYEKIFTTPVRRWTTYAEENDE